MDLLATLGQRLDSLGEGGFSPGLKAVLRHIQTAFRHLDRGQKQNDETAFTDAIYRTNQAFEGSIKEAYRVLTGKDPAKQRPYDIEKYLEEEKIFRPRVLSQFTNYRTEWRNPSTHDYKLDFDESEAFLAIISVTAFAVLLTDQITEKLSFESAKSLADSEKSKLKRFLPKESAGLLKRVVALIHEFSRQAPFAAFAAGSAHPGITESQVTGALTGFIASTMPDLSVMSEVMVGARMRLDLMISTPDERVALELKRAGSIVRINGPEAGLIQVEHYLKAGGFKHGILYYFASQPCELEESEITRSTDSGTIVVLKPKHS